MIGIDAFFCPLSFLFPLPGWWKFSFTCYMILWMAALSLKFYCLFSWKCFSLVPLVCCVSQICLLIRFGDFCSIFPLSVHKRASIHLIILWHLFLLCSVSKKSLHSCTSKFCFLLFLRQCPFLCQFLKWNHIVPHSCHISSQFRFSWWGAWANVLVAELVTTFAGCKQNPSEIIGENVMLHLGTDTLTYIWHWL